MYSRLPHWQGRAPKRRWSLNDAERARTGIEQLLIDEGPNNTGPGNRSAPGFPQFGHGSVKLGVLFNDPSEKE